MKLLLVDHADRPFGANEGANAAAFAKIIINLDVPGPLVSGDAEIRAKIPAQVTAPAEVVDETPAGLHDSRFLIQTWPDFAVIPFRTTGVLLLFMLPPHGFCFTGMRLVFLFIHQCFLHPSTNNDPQPGRPSCRLPWLPPRWSGH